MNHFYKDVEGFFDFQKMYSLAVDSVKENGHFVEIGTFRGQSAAYLAVEIINSGKNIKLDIVDCMPEPDWIIFNKNLESVSNIITTVKNDSLAAVGLYEDESLDFIFIDSSHAYDWTFQEITVWYKKIKIGGIIGGHDYKHIAYPGVEKAVHEIFGNDIITDFGTWYHIKKGNQQVEYV